MDLSCAEVWREISNYIDEDVEPALRADLEAHFARCKHCSAVLDGTRNVVQLVGDGRVFTVPAGFSERLRQSLAGRISGAAAPVAMPAVWAMAARTWWVSALAAGLVLLSFAAFRARERAIPAVKSQHSRPAARTVDEMVAITDEGKTFHVPQCPYIHGKVRMVSMKEAIRNGYLPCVRCEGELLASGNIFNGALTSAACT